MSRRISKRIVTEYEKELDEEKQHSLNIYGSKLSLFLKRPPSLTEAIDEILGEYNVYIDSTDIQENKVIDEARKIITPRLAEIKRKYKDIDEIDALTICLYTLENEENQSKNIYGLLNSQLGSNSIIKKVNIDKYLLTIFV